MTRFEIIQGPSKLELMFAFFDKPDPEKNTRRSVIFNLEKKFIDGSLWVGDLDVKAIINQLTWEDDSSEKFLFAGHTASRKTWGTSDGQNINGYFNTQTRKGWVEVQVIN